MSLKKWELLKTDKELAQKMAEECDIDPFIALLLTGRGITDKSEIIKFFSNDNPSMNPFDFKDMDKAAERIERAINDGERIAIYGDYDADGVTSTSILYSYLSAREADVIYYIPERMTDGYGLNKAAVDILKSENVQLIVTVDNGITALEEAKYIKDLGIDLVITDHHRAGNEIPVAEAVVDAYRNDCGTSFKGLSGAGVALKLVSAMEGGVYNETVDEFVDLATIGILADISPVYDENRLIIKRGIEKINNTDRVGLMALIDAAGMKDKKLNSTNLMFSIIPRINAAGRMGKAARMVQLFLTDDMDEAVDIATKVNIENNERKEVERKIIEDIEAQIQNNPDILYDRVLLFKGENWHQGVLGITAARVVEKYGRPAIILTGEEEGELSGSCRSIEGFSIFDAINSCSDKVIKFGGHTLAAGVTIKEDNFENFREALNEYAAENFFEMPFPKIEIECKIPPKGLNCTLAKSLEVIEPFGVGNKEPLFGLYAYQIESIYPLSDGKHVRVNLYRDNTIIPTVKFNTRFESFPFKSGDKIDCVVSLSTSLFRGEEQLSVFIKEIRLSGCNDDDILSGTRLFENFKRREKLDKSIKEEMLPNREEAAEVYKYFRNIKKISSPPTLIYQRINAEISYIKFRIILDILSEKKLITIKEEDDIMQIEIITNPEKQDLNTASAYEYLEK